VPLALSRLPSPAAADSGPAQGGTHLGCYLRIAIATKRTQAMPPALLRLPCPAASGIDSSEPMKNDQAYFFSDIILIFYNIIKL
jgi:hypothetical protein